MGIFRKSERLCQRWTDRERLNVLTLRYLPDIARASWNGINIPGPIKGSWIGLLISSKAKGDSSNVDRTTAVMIHLIRLLSNASAMNPIDAQPKKIQLTA